MNRRPNVTGKLFAAYCRLAMPIALVVFLPSQPAHAALEVFFVAQPGPKPFPFDGSPKVGDNITLNATVLGSLPSDHIQYKFNGQLLPGGPQFVINDPSIGKKRRWKPKRAGDYKITVVVKKGAEMGSATINDFHIKPTITSTVQLSANPPVMALPGAFTISATTAPINGWGFPQLPTVHKVWFRHVQQFPQPPNPPWQPPITSGGVNPAVWTPNRPLAPGAYGIEAYVQSFKGNWLVAESHVSGINFPTHFYRGDYIVLLPAGPCPTPTPTADPAQPFGWVNPITTQNSFNLPVATPQGSASCPVAGYSINDIANNPQLRVRTLNVSCTNCHAALMSGTAGREWLCGVLPFGFPHAQPPDNPPEETLFKLLENWWMRGCPD